MHLAQALAGIGLLLVIGHAGGLLACAVRQPKVVGYLTAGLVAGTVTSVLRSAVSEGASSSTLRPDVWMDAAHSSPVLDLLTQAGLILFVAVTAHELAGRAPAGPTRTASSRAPHQRETRRAARRAGIGWPAGCVGAAIVVVPLLSGVLLGLGPAAGHRPAEIGVAAFVLFVGLAFAASALPVMAHILHERGMLAIPPESPLDDRPPEAVAERGGVGGVGVLALNAAVVADAAVWAGLAVALALAGHTSLIMTAARLTGAIVFAAALWWLGRPLLHRLAALAQRDVLRSDRRSRSGRRHPVAKSLMIGLVVLVMVGGLVASSSLTTWLGLHAILGAFLYGLIVPATPVTQRLIDSGRRLSDRFLLPLFFTATAAGLDLSSIALTTSREDGSSGVGDQLRLGLMILVVAVTTKIGSGAAAGGRLGFNARDSLTLGVLVNCRGMTELVILTTGLTAGLTDPALFALLLAMALTTTAMTGPLLGVLGHPVPARRRLRLRQLDRQLGVDVELPGAELTGQAGSR